MNSSAYSRTQDAQRIQRLSRRLAISCLILIAVLPIVVAIYWAIADSGTLAVRAGLSPSDLRGALMSWQRVAGGLITEIPLALLLVGIWQARACFKLFAAGDVFSSEAVLCLKRFAGWAGASVAASTLAATAISIVFTLSNPPGLRQLAISIGSDQVFMLFFSGMVWLMAAVIGQGQMLAEENATFI